MNVNEFTAQDRAILLSAWRSFRAHDETDGSDHSYRNDLEQKLVQGSGELDEVERQMLAVSVNNEIADVGEITRLVALLEGR